MPAFIRENNRLRRRHSPWRYLSRTHRKLLLFFLKCVIMAVVMSLFLFFLGFAAIVLVYFLFMSNPFHRRCTRFFHHHAAADNVGGVFSVALPPDVAYRAADFPTMSDCAICLDSFREGDHCRNVPICRHLFHAKCVDRWIRKKPTCPICRTRVDLDPGGLPGSRIGREDQWKRVWTVNFEEGTSY